jgi:hypothetical protein
MDWRIGGLMDMGFFEEAAYRWLNFDFLLLPYHCW